MKLNEVITSTFRIDFVLDVSSGVDVSTEVAHPHVVAGIRQDIALSK